MSTKSSTCRRLKAELRQFVDWVSSYTLASRGMVLRMALRMGEHLGPGRERVGVRLRGPIAATNDGRALARAQLLPTDSCARRAGLRRKPVSAPV